MKHAQRGQTLPLWAGGIVAALSLLFFALNYANVLIWNIRAQNAADSAAEAITSVQTQEWNRMTSLLYATGVEEYRTRMLLEGMRLAIGYSGGCNPPGGTLPTEACGSVYQDLRDQFLRSTQRFSGDITLLNNATGNVNGTNTKEDATTLLSYLHQASVCSSNDPNVSKIAIDCAFNYKIVGWKTRNTLSAIYRNSLVVFIPRPGHPTPQAQINTNLFSPIQVEVAACSINPITPFVPLLFPTTSGTARYAVARGAATTVMTEQDWMQPGSIIDPNTNTFYQPDEYTTGPADTNGYNWYQIDFGGNQFSVDPVTGALTYNTYRDEFSELLGWWNSVPIPPFEGQMSVNSLCS